MGKHVHHICRLHPVWPPDKTNLIVHFSATQLPDVKLRRLVVFAPSEGNLVINARIYKVLQKRTALNCNGAHETSSRECQKFQDNYEVVELAHQSRPPRPFKEVQ